jgi:hypothetical protein
MQASAELADLPPLVTKTESVRSHVFRLPYSRVWMWLICAALSILVGYLDFLTGYEQSLLLFYLVPIAIDLVRWSHLRADVLRFSASRSGCCPIFWPELIVSFGT